MIWLFGRGIAKTPLLFSLLLSLYPHFHQTIALIYQASSGESIYGWITDFDTPATVTAFAIGIVVLVISCHQLWVLVSWFCRRNRRRWSQKLAKTQRSRPELEGHEIREKEFEQSESSEEKSYVARESPEVRDSTEERSGSSSSTSEIELKAKPQKKSAKEPNKKSPESSSSASPSGSSSNWNEEESDAIQTM